MEISTGIVVTFESGFLAEIVDINPAELSRISIPTSHQGTTNDTHTFKPGKLSDPGEFSCDIAFDPETEPPINEAISEIVVTFANSGVATMTFDGFMTTAAISAPLEDRMMLAVTIKITGPIAWG